MPGDDATPTTTNADDGFATVVRAPVYLQVAEQLRTAILDGRLAPGDALPTERELAESFGASRASIREALRGLQAQGLIVGGPAPASATVAEPHGQAARDAIVALLRADRVPLADLVEFRRLLEAAALRRAAREADDARLAEAREALAEMQDPGISVEDFDKADVRFHVSLVRASGNETMHLVMLALRDPVARHLLEALRADPDAAETLGRLASEHEAILDAVEAGDGERAAELVDRHIRSFYDSRLEPSA
jgi:GntR family transcriptional regulator, transcriptional repressor for pyruvate dehydrogenase complex